MQGVNCWVFWNIYQSRCQHQLRSEVDWRSPWRIHNIRERTDFKTQAKLSQTWGLVVSCFAWIWRKWWQGIQRRDRSERIQIFSWMLLLKWPNSLLPCPSLWFTPQDLVQETISNGINSFVLTLSTTTKTPKSMPLHYSKLSCLISRTSTTIDSAILSVWD